MPLFKPTDVNTLVLTQFPLAGKTAAVTDGAKGIDLEIVRSLAEAGANVAIIYATSTDAASIASDTGVKVKAYQSDVRDRNSIASTIEEIVNDFNNRLDVVVANSGVCANILSLEYTEETWKANSSINLDGVMWTAQAAGKVFRRLGRGNLIITASVLGTLVNIPQTQAAYSTSKAAAVHLGKSLAAEWVDFVRVNMVSPGFIETDMPYTQLEERFQKWMEMIPGRRMAATAELKGVYVFLSSDACCYMTEADIIVYGGYTLT